MSNDCENFCRNLRRWRLERGMSVTAFARLLRISPASLRKLESGILPPKISAQLFFVLHDELGISFREMFAGPED
ncbi:helix-turn-helix transcriptional regulator [Clostridiaceae bacterium NSJ-31]|uniref:Helix-turn-helix transcriptional regulator n=1 Tax=Ligaoa zhengdingensis TaxID=2763658 RepID=A0A926I4V0_9FIRM|nr:helix-turn-helix transcriptional regulator [Ligaoa zhengdingensis]MBC8546858.1 helix-turn-helix transcriptional regulator [Ligaoa zhengdingensis]